MLRSVVRDIFRRDESFKAIVMEAPISIVVIRGQDYIIEFANQRLLNILQKELQEVIHTPFFETFPELAEQGFRQIIEIVYHTGDPFNIEEMPIKISGIMEEPEYANFIVQPIKNKHSEVTGALGIGSNVTELVRSRKTIQESEAKYKGILERMDPGFSLMEVIFDENGKPYDYIFLEVNQSFEKLTGFKDIIGKSIRQLLPEVEDSWLEAMGKVAITGENITILHDVKPLNRAYESHAFRIGDAFGRKVAVLFNDVTQRVEEEQNHRKFEEELRRQVEERTRKLEESNAELKQFANIVTHDLKEPVRKIKTFISMLYDSLHEKATDEELSFIARINASSDRLKEMIEGVMDYSQIDHRKGDIIDIDLNQLINHIIDDLEVMIVDKSAEIAIKPLPLIQGDSQLIYPLFYNLIYNALKFSRLNVQCKINISASFEKKEEQDYVAIILTDNGIGFDEMYAEKIFDSFTRLHSKDKYEGSGMGLAMCRKIAERHGGSISARSKLNEGSEFKVLLPLKREETKV